MVIGLLVAWYFLGTRHRQQMAKREEELRKETQQAKDDLGRLRLAHETTKKHLSDVQAKEAVAIERAKSLKAELSTNREELGRLSAAHETATQRLSEAEAKATSAAARIEIQEADLTARGEELRGVKAADAESRSQLDQQRSTIDDLKARLGTTENARAQLDRQLKEAQAEHRKAEDQGRSLRADLEARVGERDEKIARLEAALAARPATSASAPAAELPREAMPPNSAGVPASGPSDDLTRIKGIGPTLKDKLYGLGITSFQQIANFTPADIARVNEVLDFPGRIEREQWVEQAKSIVQAC
ncbi:MAG: hypothetical protein OEU92_25885 [Alphaproteobacteria bacterium]|nr:hypothetical protein [Alphaproteobacteria bacterium]